jgi:hypothetical protein
MDLRFAAIPAAAVLVVTGCGGGSGKTYSASATEACLLEAGAKVDPSGADLIAQDASGGGAEVVIDGKILNIAFGKDSDEATDMLAQYKAVGGNTALYKKESAVLSWDDDPNATKAVVDGCLQ